MGLCYTKLTLEELSKSKYTLAKDTKPKDKCHRFHTYIWRYQQEDLKQKEKIAKDEDLRKNSTEQFLNGKCVPWPIKFTPDEGYIILTIRNHSALTEQQDYGVKGSESNQRDPNGDKSDFSLIQDKHGTTVPGLLQTKLPLELIEMLFMVNLNAFSSYYTTNISDPKGIDDGSSSKPKDKKNNPYHQSLTIRREEEFDVNIQIIVGDLLEPFQCLRLLSISYELEKWLKAGGHNIFKKLYNEYDQIVEEDFENLNSKLSGSSQSRRGDSLAKGQQGSGGEHKNKHTVLPGKDRVVKEGSIQLNSKICDNNSNNEGVAEQLCKMVEIQSIVKQKDYFEISGEVGKFNNGSEDSSKNLQSQKLKRLQKIQSLIRNLSQIKFLEMALNIDKAKMLVQLHLEKSILRLSEDEKSEEGFSNLKQKNGCQLKNLKQQAASNRIVIGKSVAEKILRKHHGLKEKRQSGKNQSLEGENANSIQRKEEMLRPEQIDLFTSIRVVKKQIEGKMVHRPANQGEQRKIQQLCQFLSEEGLFQEMRLNAKPHRPKGQENEISMDMDISGIQVKKCLQFDVSEGEISQHQGDETPQHDLKDFDDVEMINTSSPFACEITNINEDDRNQRQNCLKKQSSVPSNQHMHNGDGVFLEQKESPGPPSEQQEMKKQKIIFQKDRKGEKQHQTQRQSLGEEESHFLPEQLSQELKIDKNLYPILTPQKQSTAATSHLQNQSKAQSCTFDCSPVFLTTYAGSAQFNQLSKHNTKLIMNFSPERCYNYFVHDIDYKNVYLEQIHNYYVEDDELFGVGSYAASLQPIHAVSSSQQKPIDSPNQMKREKISHLERFNIETVVFEFLSLIEKVVQEGQLEEKRKAQRDAQNPFSQNSWSKTERLVNSAKICLFCGHKNLIYSGTFAMAYLMFHNSHRLPLEQAYKVIRKCTRNKFKLPIVYKIQLENLSSRIASCSSVDRINNLNARDPIVYSVYMISHVGSSYFLQQLLYGNQDFRDFSPQSGVENIQTSNLDCILQYCGRYMGEIENPNQLQTIERYSEKVFALIPNNITSIAIKIVNYLREEASSSTQVRQSTLKKSQNSDKQPPMIQTITQLLKNMGLSLRLFFGKQILSKSGTLLISKTQDGLSKNGKSSTQHLLRQHYQSKLLPELIRWQYLNFPRHVFNIEKYRSKIQTTLEAFKQVVTVEIIQKSFRTPRKFQNQYLFGDLSEEFDSQLYQCLIKSVELQKKALSLNSIQKTDFQSRGMTEDQDLNSSAPKASRKVISQPTNSQQVLSFKYPILRPIFEKKRTDSYYFMIKRCLHDVQQFNKQKNTEKKVSTVVKQPGCNVTFYKGSDWIGLQEDKQRYFEEIVKEYLWDIDEDRIWIEDPDQDSGSAEEYGSLKSRPETQKIDYRSAQMEQGKKRGQKGSGNIGADCQKKMSDEEDLEKSLFDGVEMNSEMIKDDILLMKGVRFK